MNTKHKGDIAEQAAALQALRRSWSVSRPVGDNQPYDLIFDISGALVKVQVKSAWLDAPSGNDIVDNRRTKTNRRVMLRGAYAPADFDFALVYPQELNLFYVFPVEAFIRYGSEIHIVEGEKRQRRPASAAFRDAWELIARHAAT